MEFQNLERVQHFPPGFFDDLTSVAGEGKNFTRLFMKPKVCSTPKLKLYSASLKSLLQNEFKFYC